MTKKKFNRKYLTILCKECILIICTLNPSPKTSPQKSPRNSPLSRHLLVLQRTHWVSFSSACRHVDRSCWLILCGSPQQLWVQECDECALPRRWLFTTLCHILHSHTVHNTLPHLHLSHCPQHSSTSSISHICCVFPPFSNVPWASWGWDRYRYPMWDCVIEFQRNLMHKGK